MVWFSGGFLSLLRVSFYFWFFLFSLLLFFFSLFFFSSFLCTTFKLALISLSTRNSLFSQFILYGFEFFSLFYFPFFFFSLTFWLTFIKSNSFFPHSLLAFSPFNSSLIVPCFANLFIGMDEAHTSFLDEMIITIGSLGLNSYIFWPKLFGLAPLHHFCSDLIKVYIFFIEIYILFSFFIEIKRSWKGIYQVSPGDLMFSSNFTIRLDTT